MMTFWQIAVPEIMAIKAEGSEKCSEVTREEGTINVF